MFVNDGVGVRSNALLSSMLAGVLIHGFERKGSILSLVRWSSIMSIRRASHLVSGTMACARWGIILSILRPEEEMSAKLACWFTGKVEAAVICTSSVGPSVAISGTDHTEAT